ncbi:MAG: undecaprenyl-diphosphate phosphatase [Deltaproteobacteria bacterium]|nr:undecaprenyl-diphosphate phosphatase [Deltaproteobacteria bacterium]
MTEFTWIKGIILGLVQGVTEFFPVSSSAHLVIAESWLGIRESVKTLAAFDVALHFGTLVAAIFFFKKDLECLFGVWFPKWRQKLEGEQDVSAAHPPMVHTGNAKKMGPLIILGVLPAGFITAKFGPFFSDIFSDTIVVAILLIITGFVISTTRRIHGDTLNVEKIGFKQALLVGLAQIFSVLPGISRSGVTISTGLFLRFKPELAFRFSFLMMIPLTAVTLIMDIPKILNLPPGAILAAVFGSIVAGVSGYFCIPILLEIVRRKKFFFFSYYCWAAGTLVLIKEMFF